MATSPSPLSNDVTEETEERKLKKPADVVNEAFKEVSAKNSDKGPRQPQDQ
jgi:hypothetical protein